MDTPRHAHSRSRKRHRRSAPSSSRTGRGTGPAAGLAITATASPAADTAPHLVASFTRQVQPLILNKCAAGACHGGPAAHSPRFQRGHVSGQLDRADTLANIESLLAVVTSPQDLASFLATISRRHPSDSAKDSLRLTPITPQERATLERWLDGATGHSFPGRPAAPLRSATASLTAASAIVAPAAQPAPAAAAATPNRFRMMLEAAANPPPLPPPADPQGIILGKDRGE